MLKVSPPSGSPTILLFYTERNGNIRMGTPVTDMMTHPVHMPSNFFIVDEIQQVVCYPRPWHEVVR